MKKLIFLFILISPTSIYPDWMIVANSKNGDTYYVDAERIREIDGYIYFWRLRDYFNEDEYGDRSSKSYQKADCKLFRAKSLTMMYFTESMGSGEISTYDEQEREWIYPAPDSNSEAVLRYACNYN